MMYRQAVLFLSSVILLAQTQGVVASVLCESGLFDPADLNIDLGNDQLRRFICPFDGVSNGQVRLIWQASGDLSDDE